MEVIIVLLTMITVAFGAVIYYAHAWFGAVGLIALVFVSIALYALYLRRCYRNASR